MAEETKFKARTGLVTISTANSNLDGTGTMGTLLTAGSNGTYIKSIIIKAQEAVSKGMIRLFIDDGNDPKLFMEVPVERYAQAGSTKTFERHIILNMKLQSGYILKVSTENSNIFNVIAESNDWSYNTTAVNSDMTEKTSSVGASGVSTANSNLDGTGTLATIISAGAPASYSGLSISNITIKATSGTSTGMIRFFIEDGASNKYLFTEVLVPDTDRSSGLDESYERIITLMDDLDLQAGYSLMASTQIGDNFEISADGFDWTYAR